MCNENTNNGFKEHTHYDEFKANVGFNHDWIKAKANCQIGGEKEVGEREARIPEGHPANRVSEGARGAVCPLRPCRTYRLMVRSRVRGLVCWMYLLPNWLTPRGQPVCERFGGTTDMLNSSDTGDVQKAGARGEVRRAGSGYLRPAQKPPPAINSREQEELNAHRKWIGSGGRKCVWKGAGHLHDLANRRKDGAVC